MAGHINGVAAKIAEIEPKGIYIHCLAHSVNLCLQECAKQSRPIRDALALVSELHNLIKASPKRLAMFEKMIFLLLETTLSYKVDGKNWCNQCSSS